MYPMENIYAVNVETKLSVEIFAKGDMTWNHDRFGPCCKELR